MKFWATALDSIRRKCGISRRYYVSMKWASDIHTLQVCVEATLFPYPYVNFMGDHFILMPNGTALKNGNPRSIRPWSAVNFQPMEIFHMKGIAPEIDDPEAYGENIVKLEFGRNEE